MDVRFTGLAKMNDAIKIDSCYVIHTGIYGQYAAQLIDGIMTGSYYMIERFNEYAKYTGIAAFMRKYGFAHQLVWGLTDREVVLVFNKNTGFATPAQIQKIAEKCPKEKLVKITECFLMQKLQQLDSKYVNEFLKILRRRKAFTITADIEEMLNKTITLFYSNSPIHNPFYLKNKQRVQQPFHSATIRDVICAVLLLENKNPKYIISLVGLETYNKIKGTPDDPFIVEYRKSTIEECDVLVNEVLTTYPFAPTTSVNLNELLKN